MPISSPIDDGTGRATVEFRLPAESGAEQAWLCGEFNEWATDATPLRRLDDGSLAATLELEPGSYRFRYYLGDGNWENDWAADAYVDNEHGGQDSLVVVAPAPAPPPPVKKATKKKAAAKKTAGVKKAAAKKAQSS